MTRRLPWRRDDDAPATTPVKRRTPAGTTTPRRVVTPQRATPKPKPTPAIINHSNHGPARSNGFLDGRTPSTSPPPQPLPETSPIEGLDDDDDDRYRMVEDELAAVAGRFTAHLHAAEYQRLQTHARSQNAETIKSISRPVVGSLTELARRRQEELLRRKKQREALRRAKAAAGRDDAESGDDAAAPTWHGTSLQGLMRGPKKSEVPLAALTRSGSGTGAMLGGVVKTRGKRPAPAPMRKEVIEEETETETETEDESDDLDGPVRAPVAVAPKPVSREPIRPPTMTSRASTSTTPATGTKAATHTRTSSVTEPKAISSKISVAPASTGVANMDDDDDDDEDLFTSFKNRRARTRERTLVKKKDPSEQKPVDIIPSFI
ncbi:hypothetical protein CSOJ01_07065 [Colletotrichum sojae]|uniref:Uncharacterized protein n=1 Tax=Colletotrichum sojae TaxID=2175907 RepID=A0A8H6J9X3_9PEZI|nr:hypothetical protein CSOJ01_07065 [Colletotrichum sojae]